MPDFFSGWQDQLWIVFHVALAAVLGGLIGIERESANRPAGIRTLALTAAGACLLLTLGESLVLYYHEITDEQYVEADPTRILHAIIVGISFLGAGSIITGRDGASVKGLTTAATVLFVAALGMAVALKLYVLSVTATVLTLVVLLLLRRLEAAVGTKEKRGEKRDNASQD
jgi:putative Mg2+ transporter-C (MgtC) family protein